MGSKFTAGVQSTQRVESTYRILKRYIKSNTSLREVFQRIEERVAHERLTSSYLIYKMEGKIVGNDFKDMFPDIIKLNGELLGTGACSQLTTEMMRSLYHDAKLHEQDGRTSTASASQDSCGVSSLSDPVMC